MHTTTLAGSSSRGKVARAGLVVATITTALVGVADDAAASSPYTYAISATVSVGGPYAVAADAGKVYVVQNSANAVAVLDTATNTVVDSIGVGAGPSGIAVDPSSHTKYVANSDDDTVTVIDATDTVIATVPVWNEPIGVGLDPALQRAYVSNCIDDSVSVIDMTTNTLSTVVPLGACPTGTAVDPTAGRVYVANAGDGTLSIIDEATNHVDTVTVGTNPQSVAVDPSTGLVYVGNLGGNSVSVVDPTTATVSATIGVGSNVYGIAIDAARHMLYAAVAPHDTIVVIDTRTKAVTDSFAVSGFPRALAVDPTTHTIYVAQGFADTVSAVTATPVPPPPVHTTAVDRIAGADRFETAVDASRAIFADDAAGAVVLAASGSPVDAAVGAPLAAAKNAPLLLTASASLPGATASEIARVLPSGGAVYLLGGPVAIAPTVETQLGELGFDVVRYGGVDRYATAVAVAHALGDPTTVLLAADAADALVAGPAAAHANGAVLLTAGSTMPASSASYIAAHADSLYAVGGAAAHADPDATAIVGADRYATATLVATTFFGAPWPAAVAGSLSDAAVGAAFMASRGGPLLLTEAFNDAASSTDDAPPASLTPAAAAYLTAHQHSLAVVHVFGGEATLPDGTKRAIVAAVQPQ